VEVPEQRTNPAETLEPVANIDDVTQMRKQYAELEAKFARQEQEREETNTVLLEGFQKLMEDNKAFRQQLAELAGQPATDPHKPAPGTDAKLGKQGVPPAELSLKEVVAQNAKDLREKRKQK
jgi:hypothetical protein